MRVLITIYPAPLTPRGFIHFVNIRPDQRLPQMWFCDECGERVRASDQAQHARDHH